MDLIHTKILVAIIFGLWRFFFGILPVKLDKCLRKWEESSSDSKTFINKKRHEQVTCAVALTQSFGGGVMFATCFLHMMKELFFSIEEMKGRDGVVSEYPVSQLIISLSFFFIYFLEEFTHWLVNRTKRKHCPSPTLSKVASAIIKHKGSTQSSARSTPRGFNSAKVTPVKTIATIEEWDLNNKNKILLNDYQNEDDFSKNPIIFNKPDDFLASPAKTEKSFSRTASGKSRHSIKEELDRADNAELRLLELTPEDEEQIKNQEQLIRCVLTIAALSLHSILEGLSIGIQKFKSEIWYLFVAVSIHSASILFCMGVELILVQTRVRFIVIQMAALALASPIGIILGLLVTVETSMKTQSMSVVTVILEGLSAGTILYVTFFEVLNREKQRRVYRLKRCLCIMAGFGLMALLQYSESKCGKHESIHLFKHENLSNVSSTIA